MPRNLDKEEIPIDKDVPIPKRQYKYPFDRMSVGDSFWIAKDSDAMTAVIRYWSDKLNATFYTKSMPNNDGVVGTRIWRTQ